VAVSQQDAARELLRRRRARASLVAYSQAIEIPGAPVSEDPDEWLFKPIESSVASHHILIMEAIQRCIETDYGRLILMLPPGSAKSTYASVVAPTWAMGKFPGLRVVMTSYAAAPILRASKKARQIVRSSEYQSIWPERPSLPKGGEAADEWELTNGSGILAAGLLGGITSSRADLGIIDDPVAGREEADSENNREKVKAAYVDDFLTRLKPKASVILIQTRWHEDDLAGGILPSDYAGQSGPVLCRDGKVWEVLCLPAKAERADDPLGRAVGEYLWPEWFGPDHWAIYEGIPRTWSSLFQQRPVPDIGGQFSREWFDWYEPHELPKRLRVYGSSDWAVTKKQESNTPDFTEHHVWGSDSAGDLWWLDGEYMQEAPDKGIDAKLRLTRMYGVIQWFDRAGGIRNATEPLTNRMMQEQSTWVVTEYLPDSQDKIAKATSFRGRASARRVHFPVGHPMAVRTVDQLCAFPMAKNDDAVDACANVGSGLDFIAKADPAPANAAPVPAFGSIEWLESNDQSSRFTETQKAAYYR